MPCSSFPLVVQKTYQDIHYCPYLRWLPAFFFSTGKIIQSAGQTVVGVNATLTYLSSSNAFVNMTIAIFLMLVNVAVNSLTRAPKIYRYFLRHKIYLASELPLIDTLGWHDGYALSLADNKLYQRGYNPDALKNIDLTTKGLTLLSEFQTSLGESSLVLESSGTLLLPGQSQRFISPDLTAQHFSLFSTLLSHKAKSSSYSLAFTPWLDKCLYFACALSILPVSMSAYLSTLSLIEVFCPRLNLTLQIIIGYTVTLCSFVSYANFNAPKMQEGVSAFCQSIDDGFGPKKNFGLPKKALALTLITTFFGTISGAGMVFFLTNKALNKFPLTQHLPCKIKQALLFLCVATSVFISIFVFAYSCFDLIKIKFPETTNTAIRLYRPRPLYAILTLLIDSTSNSLGSFIGMTQVAETYFPSGNRALACSLFVLNILSLLNTIIMQFSLGLVGSEQAVDTINQITCCCKATKIGLDTVDKEPKPDELEAPPFTSLESHKPASLTLAAPPLASQNLGNGHYKPLPLTLLDVDDFQPSL